MYLEIYIDMLFLINFLMDIILLKIVKKVQKLNSTTIRLFLAGIVGAINGCVIVLLPSLNNIFKFVFIYVFTSYLMVRIAFRFTNRRDLFKNIIMLFIITFFSGGFLNSLYFYTNLGYYFHELLKGGLHPSIKGIHILIMSPLFFIVIKLFIRILDDKKKKVQTIYEVELKYEKDSLVLKGFYDTGNSLRDPILNKPVAIAEYESVKKLLPKNLQSIIETYYEKDNIYNIPFDIITPSSLRFIPYHSIGREKGMLIGVVFKEVLIHNSNNTTESIDDSNYMEANNSKVIVALHKGKLSNKNDYQIILHKELL